MGALVAVPAEAQGAAEGSAPLSEVDDETQVSSLAFRFASTESVLVSALTEQVATTAPSLTESAVFRALRLGSKKPHPLNPIELQKDLVRLSRFYARNGYPQAVIDYEVDLDSASNRAGVAFLIEEGPPLLIRDVVFAGRSVPEQLVPELRPEWADFVGVLGREAGRRLTDFRLLQYQNRTLQWLRNRGYAFADVSVEQAVDSTGLVADVRLKVNAFDRARYGEIVIEGNEAIEERIIRRELGFETGDLFDGSDLGEAQREVFGLAVFQLATVNVVADQPRDSTVEMRVRVQENPLRVARAFSGFYTEGGLTGRAEATHRNAFGGARTATLGLEARTGLFDQSGVDGGLYDYGASLTLRQPYVLDRRLSLGLTPAVRSRNDEIERSRAVSGTASLLYTRRALQTGSVSATIQQRQISPRESGGIFSLTSLDADSLQIVSALVGADVTAGFVDDPLQPRRGVILRPSVRASVPGLSDQPFVRGRVGATGFLPLGETLGVTLRGIGAAFAPVGGTTLDVPAGGAPITYALLRDQYTYAGGSTDVRGWSTTLLGPKIPDFRVDELTLDDDTVRLDTTVTGYTAIGGRYKVLASAQLNLPLPIGPQWGASAFVDAGRIWPAATFDFGDSPLAEGLEARIEEENAFRFGVGAGVQYLTPIGFVGLALAAKLNPSYFDLRSADDIFCGPAEARSAYDDGGLRCDAGLLAAGEAGRDFDFDAVEPSTFFGLFPSKLLQLHFAFGQTF